MRTTPAMPTVPAPRHPNYATPSVATTLLPIFILSCHILYHISAAFCTDSQIGFINNAGLI
jgi:hypothetical protein